MGHINPLQLLDKPVAHPHHHIKLEEDTEDRCIHNGSEAI
jgi:hypothetical protein